MRRIIKMMYENRKDAKETAITNNEFGTKLCLIIVKKV